MSYLLSGLDLVVNNTTSIVVNTNQTTIQGDIATSENVIAVNSTYNRFSVPDNTAAATIKSTSKALSLTGLTAKAVGTTQVPTAATYTNDLGSNLNINYDGEYYVKLLLFNTSASTIVDSSNNNYTIVNTSDSVWLGAAGPQSGPFAGSNSWFFNYLESDFLRINSPISSLLGAEDFTIEFFIRGSTSWSNLPVIIDTGSNLGFQYWQVSITATGQVQFTYTYGTTTTNVVTTSTIGIASWWHVAIVRNNTVQIPGNNFNIYINGVSGVSALIANNWGDTGTNAGTVVIGKSANNTRYLPANLSNLRITQSAVYIGNFTPPTSNLQIAQGSSTNISLIPAGRKSNTRYSTTSVKSATYEPLKINLYNNLKYSAPTGQQEIYDPDLVGNSKINSYVVGNLANKHIKSDTEIVNVSLSPEFYVNGPDSPIILSTDGQGEITARVTGALVFNNNLSVVSYAGNPEAANITADFTLEFWINPRGWGQNVYQRVMGNYEVVGAGWDIRRVDQGNKYRNLTVFFSDFGQFVTTGQVDNDIWQHWALVRSGSALSWWKNGVLDSTTTMTRASNLDLTDFTSPFTIGRGQVGNNENVQSAPFEISNLRIVKGTALYTTTFTPLLPLDIVTNTTFLLSTANALTKLVDKVSLSTLTSNSVEFTNLGPVVNNVVSTIEQRGVSGSLAFNGTTRYLNVAGTNPQFAFGTGDFTIEMWIYQIARSATNAVLYDSRPAGTGSGASHFGFSIGPAGEIFTAGAGTISLNTWYHIAIGRSGTTLTAYVNGVAMYNGTDTTNWLNGTNRPTIGTDGNVPLSNGYTFNGYISNLRVVKGTAVYTANFAPVPPLTAITNTQLLLLANSDANKTIDSSVNNFTVTNTNGVLYSSTIVPTYLAIAPIPTNLITPIQGGGSFNGTNQYLTAPIGSSTFGSGDFTAECWFYKTSAVDGTLMSNVTGSINNYWTFATLDNGTIRLGIRDSVVDDTYLTGSIATSINTWVHVAAVRQSGVCSLYVNGVFDNSATITKTVTARTTNIGSFQYPGYITYFPGYISNVRLVTGLAVYTGNFTVPTKPLTKEQNAGTNIQAILATQTSLLTLQDPQLVDNSSLANTITNNNGVIVASTYSPTWAAYAAPLSTGGFKFAGGASNQRLSIPASGAFNLSGGTWTIEFWMYSTDTPTLGNQCRILMLGANSTTSALVVGYNNNGTISIAVPFNPITSNTSATGAVTLNRWYHVAIVSTAGSNKIFINGTQSGNTTTITQPTSSTPVLNIGYDTVATVNFQYAGYLSNIRIVNGLGVYTGNFNVPTSPLTKTQISSANTNAITGSQASLLIGQDSTVLDLSDYSHTITTNGVTPSALYGPVLGTVSSSSTIATSPGAYVSTPPINTTNIEYINYRTDPRSVNKRVKNLIVGTTGVLEELQSWS